MKKFWFIILLLLFFLVTKPVLAREPVVVYFFYGQGCPHCAKEEIFLDKIEKTNPNVEIKRYEIWYNADNQKLFIKIGKELNIKTSGVPVTIINGQAFYGYYNDEITGEMLLNKIQMCQQMKCDDPVASIINQNEKERQELKEKQIGLMSPSPQTTKSIPEELKVPLLGKIKIKSLSLPLLTILIGALDGFNPCAMWVLLFLISLLLGMKNRKRMWLLGSVFIIASALSYFVFMTAWLNLFLFIGLIFWVRSLVGLFAFGSGFYHLKKYWTKKTGCSADGYEKKSKIFEWVKSSVSKKGVLLAMLGIASLAFAVNLIELMCSAGFPAIYTQILSLTMLPKWQYYLYLLLYIFVFMLDDLIVFFVAMITLRSVAVSTKYGYYSNLIGGILMIIIGILLIFKPDWLMFG
jgi:thiol-disulfide isomerase/thioredoxin